MKRLLVGTTLAAGALRLAGAVAAIALAGASSGPSEAQSGPAQRTVWLEQGWTEPVRAAYHHQSQGTATFPIPATWFLALQQPNPLPTAGLFSDPAYLDRFGFIPSPRDPVNNPDGLPIGFARSGGTNPVTGQPLDGIGLTCAACHTSRIEYGRTTMLIDGGPALINLGDFGLALAAAMAETLTTTRFNRFAARVEAIEGHPVDRAEMRRRLRAIVLAGLGSMLDSPRGTKEGWGRLDALNRIGNTVFGAGLGIKENMVATSAPVAFPHIWDTAWFAWVQYNGSIEQPMVRNAGEAMGVNAVVNYNGVPQSPRFTSSIPVGDLHERIERPLAGDRPPLPDRRFSGLTSPRWPADILTPIKPALAARGATLYGELCQGCHLPPPGSDAFWQSDRWTPANAAGERYLNLAMVQISRVGTDGAQARDMTARTVLARNDLGLTGGTDAGNGMSRYPFAGALGQVVQLVTNRWYDEHNVPPAERERLNGNRPNNVRGLFAYKARPLNGIWATAPYLHNGSVPTLYALLSPQNERPSAFRLGDRRFDPVNVGFVDGGSFRLETNRPGNSNAGHQFDGPAGVTDHPSGTIGRGLSRDERLELIEYLKTL
jgi:mono/diheme cytochrome c family protein